MPIIPSETELNTWNICFTTKVDGQLRVHKEIFVGSIREAVFYEMQLRGQAKDGNNYIKGCSE